MNIFSRFQVAISSLFFGPIAGAIMTGLSRRHLGYRDWYVYLFVSPLAILAFWIFIIITLGATPDESNLVVSILSAIWYAYVQHISMQAMPQRANVGRNTLAIIYVVLISSVLQFGIIYLLTTFLELI